MTVPARLSKDAYVAPSNVRLSALPLLRGKSRHFDCQPNRKGDLKKHKLSVILFPRSVFHSTSYCSVLWAAR